jgi:hypothetical protein
MVPAGECRWQRRRISNIRKTIFERKHDKVVVLVLKQVRKKVV